MALGEIGLAAGEEERFAVGGVHEVSWAKQL